MGKLSLIALCSSLLIGSAVLISPEASADRARNCRMGENCSFNRHVDRDFRDYRDYRNRGRHFRRDGDRAYYNGWRGNRHHHDGYRYYNGYWFPPAAFLGLTFGGIVGAAQGSSHVERCYAAYRSYREWDDTYQPYDGPRRRCRL